ncbi:MAG: hypothetical protein HY054_02500 [Proteobacteria bacterium]|nr:hypothetical protein [Pseudomonadota bacterium]
MRKLMVAALAAGFAIIAPSIASARVSGVLTVGYEHSDINFSNNYCGECSYYGDETEQGPSLSAAVIAPLMGEDSNWVIQGEGRLQSEKEDYNYGYRPHYNVGHAAVHIAYRNDSYAVGGFYAIQNDHGSDVQEIGVEAQKYFSNMTLQGSVAYGHHDRSCSGCGDDVDAWDAQAGLNYYINDSWTAGVNVGYASWDYSYNGRTNLTTIGVNAEYRIPNTNYSVRAAYTHGDANSRYNDDYTSETVQVAFVVDFGSENARDRDQHGASFSGADVLDQQWRLWEASVS